MRTDELRRSGIPYTRENNSYRLQTGELVYEVMGHWFVGDKEIDESWLLHYIGQQPVSISPECMAMLGYYTEKCGVYCQVVGSKFIDLCQTDKNSAIALIGGVMLLGSLSLNVISDNKVIPFTGTIQELVDIGRGVQDDSK